MEIALHLRSLWVVAIIGSPWTARTTREAAACSKILFPSSTNSLDTRASFFPVSSSRASSRSGEGGEVYS
jgi:hypothetical protein